MADHSEQEAGRWDEKLEGGMKSLVVRKRTFLFTHSKWLTTAKKKLGGGMKSWKVG